MTTQIRKSRLLSIALFAVLMASTLTSPGAPIVTNWVAFNDHRPGPLPQANAWGTALRVTAYDMRVGPAGTLTNFQNGQQLPVTMTVTPNGAPDDFGQTGPPYPILAGTPAHNLFFGIVDVGNTNSVIGVRISATTFVTLTFNNLDPAKHYVFRGTSARGGSYPLRWTAVAITGADTFVDAHISGTGPGVITSNNFPTAFQPGQAAFNSGDNRPGAVVGWDFISPGADGSFSIVSSNYAGPIPAGGNAAADSYGYAISAMLLAEVEAAPPAIVTQPAAETTVEQNRPFSLSVSASGTPLLYQWYKQGLGAIGGATAATYPISKAALGDSGDYYAVVYNPLNSVTSSLAHVTINADTNPPAISTAFSYPSFDTTTRIASLDQVIVEFSEAVDPITATASGNYQVSGGVMLNSVTMTNDRTAILKLTTPLAEDADYTVQVSGVLDLVNNAIVVVGTTNPAPFRSWTQGPGNTLLYEAYNTGAGTDVPSFTNDLNFPDNPYFRTNLWAFDSRLAYPDDSHNNYGSRTRGVFIPPVSGDWVFFLRSGDRSSVYFNPNGLDAAGKVLLVAEVTGANGDWNKLISSPVTLRAGHGYYIEGLQKADASGIDYIKLAARLAGTGLPVLGVVNTEIDTNALMGGAICSPYAPRDLDGPLTITQQPANVSEEATHYATFSVQVSNPNNLPIIYQWFRDGLPIPGANGPSYTFRTVIGDDGATLSVQAAKVGASVTSQTATLSVRPDVTKPTVVAVHGSYRLDQVIVSFSEPVDTNLDLSFSFTIPTFTLLSVVGDATGTNVILTFDLPLALGSTNDLAIADVQDFATPTANILDTTNVAVRAWVMSRGFALEQLYLDIGSGTTVPDLTGNAKYPNSPDVVAWVPTLEGPTGRYDNYGTRLSGWIAPPVGGDYLFYFCSDDGGNLLLSLDADPANAMLIAQENSYADARTWTGDRDGGTRGTPPSNILTNPIPMTTGQMYAFVALEKDGTGGDNSGANWQIPGYPVPTNGSPGIAGAHLYSLADPLGASITVTQQPANVETALPATLTFSVGVASTFKGLPNANVTYIWQRDDGAGFVDIIGAYSRTYSVDLTPAEAAAKVRVLAFSPGASVASQAAGVSASLRVSVTRNGNVVRISWPLPGTGITLERTTTLIGNPPPWAPVPPPYQTDATSVYVEIPAPVGNAFYRLVQ